jgi:hypothetical protein
MTEERKNEIRLELKKNLILFGKTVMSKTFSKPSPNFHYELAELYHDKNEDLVNIIAPRHHAKSSLLAEAAPLHHLMYDPGKKVIVIISKTEGHAKDRLQAIKDILDYGNEFIELFGDWGRNTARKWTDSEIILKDGSAIICKGTGQQIIGLKRGHQRPTYVVLDDPEDENNTKTPEAMQHNFRILLKGIMPGVDSDRGRIFVIGTPQNSLCMVEKIKKMTGWTTRQYDAIVDEELHLVLWPELWSWEKLKEKKDGYEAVGQLSVYYSEYRCTIKSDEEQTFRDEWIKYYKGIIEWQDDEAFLCLTKKDGMNKEEKLPVNIFTGIDPASSEEIRADYTVIMHCAVDEHRNFYQLPYIRKRMQPTETIDTIIKEYKKWKPKRVSLETSGSQEVFRDILRKLDNLYIPGLEVKNNPRDSKMKRYIETMQPYFARGKVFLLEGECETLLDELLLFRPGGKSKDDTVDGLYWSMKKAYSPTHIFEEKKTENKSWRKQEQEWFAYALG